MVHKDLYLLCRSEEFHLASGQEASIDLRLKKAPPIPCTKLCGEVVGNGAQIQGATVKILNLDTQPVCHTETDRNGEFAFMDTLPPGNYEIIASADGYLISEVRYLSLKPLVPLHVTLRLTPDSNADNAALYGTVRNSENIRLPDVQVRVFSDQNAECLQNITKTNADGEYLFPDLEPGKYRISALHHGYTQPRELTVELLPKDLFHADLYLYRDLSEEKGTISGVVLCDGHAAPFAVAALYRKESGGYSLIQIQQTNSSGVYFFSGLKAGEYMVATKPENDMRQICVI